jgi:hypothetical protein
MVGEPQVILLGHAIEGGDSTQGGDDLPRRCAFSRGKRAHVNVEFGRCLH